MPNQRKKIDSELDGDSLPLNDEIILYRSYWSDGLLLSLLIISAIAGFYLSGAHPFSFQYVDFDLPNRAKLSLPIPFYALFPVLLLVIIIHRTFNARYIIAEDHVRSIQGLYSLFLNDKRIDFENIRGVEVTRNFYHRVVNLGDLVIGSSMHAGDELVMSGIHRPHYYRDILEARVRSFLNRDSSNSKQNKRYS